MILWRDEEERGIIVCFPYLVLIPIYTTDVPSPQLSLLLPSFGDCFIISKSFAEVWWHNKRIHTITTLAYTQFTSLSGYCVYIFAKNVW